MPGTAWGTGCRMAVAQVARRHDVQRTRSARVSFVLEVASVLALFAAYNVGRLIATGREHSADGHAWELIDLERWLRLPAEATLQRLAFDVPHLVSLSDRYYVAVHFPVTIAVLVWLYLYRRPAYTWAKRALIVATGVAMVIHIALPMTPPRLLNGLGMVDTGAHAGQSVYVGSPIGGLANEYAAMPSLHVGWALLLAVVLIHTGRSRIRWSWLLHPIATTVVVVVTANHYLLDVAAGAALVLVALWVTHRLWPVTPGESAHVSPEPAVSRR
ncbi:MAG: inositol phosphorylceramide synthase [Actinobacteria bacterium]|uniref:Unannotated protein n=1 Tax=freshwater metagenome TaxID=449393 RepID=A0A6J6P1X2_9ZZZZ|nr:inositol phosphorylceramide synthase [Actinomycetota bacterium]